MTGSGRAVDVEVNVFEVDDTVVFKHYFEDEKVFARLKPFYNHSQYRFDVPPEEFAELRSFLAEHGYELVVVEAVSKFVVVVEKYTAHPENIFTDSVMQRSTDGHNCFLLTDQYAVAGAVAEGATRLSDIDLPNPFR
ncbi:MAG: hypothetical protein BRD23_08120 [Halobacteriales archaeon SW_9_67_25]|jgi:hypothetical protein|nr:MAG: hypothetical protein BRD23_08120 [Halobacteriales archaeon SW_9_67_25]